MVRQVEIKVTCTRCEWSEGVSTPAEQDCEETVRIGGTDLVFDLCKGCHTTWFEPLNASLREFGLDLGNQQAGPGARLGVTNPKVCPICPDTKYTAAKSCREHLQRHHPEFYASEAAKIWWPRGPKLACPYCDKVQIGGTGLAAHKRHAHPEEFAREQAEKPAEDGQVKLA